MNRYRTYWPLDDAPLKDGDGGFVGVDERWDAGQLPPGFVASATNCRFRARTVRTRPGDSLFGWMRAPVKLLLSSLTNDGAGTCTATTSAAHGLVSGDRVVVMGDQASPAYYNGLKYITVTGSTTFTYRETAAAGAVTSPATGTLYVCHPGTMSAVLGQAVTFSDPVDGLEWQVFAANGGVYATRPNNFAKSVALPSGVTLTEADCVQFVQCFEVLLLLRGDDTAPLVCASGLDAGFTEVTASASGTGTLPIPNSRFGIFFGNRALLVNDRDLVAVSDALDYTHYTLYQNFRINQGDNDAMVAMAPFNESTVVMLKDQSVWRVDNIYGDLSSIALRKVTNQYGCVAPFSVVQFGTDLAWFSERGVESLKLTEQGQVQGVSLALSAKLPKTIARLNWQHASKIVGAYWDGKLYFAVPLDNAQVVDTTVNLLRNAGNYNGSGVINRVYVNADTRYQWTPGSNDSSATIGGTTFYGPGIYNSGAQTNIILGGTASAAANGTLYRVVAEGVNNAVMVFDTETGEWCGTDERDGLNIKTWLTVTVMGRRRLAYLSNTGEFHLYEEGRQDEAYTVVNQPYVDVVVHTRPSNGTTFLVYTENPANADTVTASTALTSNSGFSWACSTSLTLAQVGSALWLNNDAGYGGLSPLWAGEVYSAAQIPGGVRFKDDTLDAGGTSPIVRIAGVDYTTTGYGNFAWLDYHVGLEIQPVSIETDVLLRAYQCQEAGRKTFDSLRLSLGTWSPTYTVTTQTEGVGETSTVVNAKTRSRTAYTTAGTAAYTVTNTGNNFASPYREDYSLAVTTSGFQFGTAGVTTGLEQRGEEFLPLRNRGEELQVQLTNTTGVVELFSCYPAARPGERSFGTRV